MIRLNFVFTRAMMFVMVFYAKDGQVSINGVSGISIEMMEIETNA